MGEQHSDDIVALLLHRTVGVEFRSIDTMEDIDGGIRRWCGEAGKMSRRGGGVFREHFREGIESGSGDGSGAEGAAGMREEVGKGEIAFAEEEDGGARRKRVQRTDDLFLRRFNGGAFERRRSRGAFGGVFEALFGSCAFGGGVGFGPLHHHAVRYGLAFFSHGGGVVEVAVVWGGEGWRLSRSRWVEVLEVSLRLRSRTFCASTSPPTSHLRPDTTSTPPQLSPTMPPTARPMKGKSAATASTKVRPAKKPRSPSPTPSAASSSGDTSDGDENAPPLDPMALLRAHFESQFAPIEIEPVIPPTTINDGDDDEDDEMMGEYDSALEDGSGGEDEEENEKGNVVEVVHFTGGARIGKVEAEVSKRERKAFFVSSTTLFTTGIAF